MSDDLLPVDLDPTFDAVYGTTFKLNWGGGNTSSGGSNPSWFAGGAVSGPTPTAADAAPTGANPGGGGGNGAMDFFNSDSGSNLIGGAVTGLFSLIQTGILVDQAKKNPGAANLLTQAQDLERRKAAGADPAIVNAQLAALAQQNQALIGELQSRKGSLLENPVVVVAGMLTMLGLGAVALIGLSRGSGRRDHDPNVIDLPPGSWSY